jgi:hypothetical protein
MFYHKTWVLRELLDVVLDGQDLLDHHSLPFYIGIDIDRYID